MSDGTIPIRDIIKTMDQLIAMLLVLNAHLQRLEASDKKKDAN